MDSTQNICDTASLDVDIQTSSSLGFIPGVYYAVAGPIGGPDTIVFHTTKEAVDYVAADPGFREYDVISQFAGYVVFLDPVSGSFAIEVTGFINSGDNYPDANNLTLLTVANSTLGRSTCGGDDGYGNPTDFTVSNGNQERSTYYSDAKIIGKLPFGGFTDDTNVLSFEPNKSDRKGKLPWGINSDNNEIDINSGLPGFDDILEDYSVRGRLAYHLENLNDWLLDATKTDDNPNGKTMRKGFILRAVVYKIRDNVELFIDGGLPPCGPVAHSP